MSRDPFEYDLAKSRLNRDKHGKGLDDFRGFDEEPIVIPDGRGDYGEDRFRAFGRIEGIGYMIVYTVRGERVRLISFRRAREREIQRYER
jgi:uncharacterized DUF497 family protein